MTTTKALEELTEAIRSEVLDEVIAHLTAYRAGLGTDRDEHNDGVDDAILTVRELVR